MRADLLEYNKFVKNGPVVILKKKMKKYIIHKNL